MEHQEKLRGAETEKLTLEGEIQVSSSALDVYCRAGAVRLAGILRGSRRVPMGFSTY